MTVHMTVIFEQFLYVIKKQKTSFDHMVSELSSNLFKKILITSRARYIRVTYFSFRKCFDALKNKIVCVLKSLMLKLLKIKMPYLIGNPRQKKRERKLTFASWKGTSVMMSCFSLTISE